MKTHLLTLELDPRSRAPVARRFTIDLADMVTLIDWNNPDEAMEQLRDVSEKYEPVSISHLPPLDVYQDESYFVKGVSILTGNGYFVDLRGNKRSVPRKVKIGEGDGVYGVLFVRLVEDKVYTSLSKYEIFMDNVSVKGMTYSEVQSKSGIYVGQLNFRRSFMHSERTMRSEIESDIENALETEKVIMFKDDQIEYFKEYLQENPNLKNRVFGV